MTESPARCHDQRRPRAWTLVKLLAVIALATTSVHALDGERLPTPEQLKADKAKNVRRPATYDPARSAWKAKYVAIRQAPVIVREDYATLRYGHPWNFDDNTLQGLKGQLNLKDLRVEKGVLSYTTGENAEIFWGNHYGNNPEYGEESIGAAWTGHWQPIHLRLRIKQSLPSSDWEISMCQGQDAWMWRMKKPLQLKGTEWQTLDLSAVLERHRAL